MEVDLSVDLGPLRLRNPVMNASGTFGYGGEWPELTNAAALGAIVTKTLTVEPRPGNPPPRLVETPAGLLNSIGLQNVGVDAFLQGELPRLRGLLGTSRQDASEGYIDARSDEESDRGGRRTAADACEAGPRLIASVGGHSAAEFAECVVRLEEGALDAYEVNISCPNVARGGQAFARSPDAAAEVVRAVRRSTRRPLFVKLSPNVTDIVEIGRACLAEGADGLTAVNTFVGMAVDIEAECPTFYRGSAGLSGPAIRPLALHKVWELRRQLNCPLIGVGGITTAHDAWQFLLIGANAVQVGTAHFREPNRSATLVRALADLSREKGVSRIGDLIGRLKVPRSG